jgi:hypothetical protein
MGSVGAASIARTRTLPTMTKAPSVELRQRARVGSTSPWESPLQSAVVDYLARAGCPTAVQQNAVSRCLRCDCGGLAASYAQVVELRMGGLGAFNPRVGFDPPGAHYIDLQERWVNTWSRSKMAASCGRAGSAPTLMQAERSSEASTDTSGNGVSAGCQRPHTRPEHEGMSCARRRLGLFAPCAVPFAA